MTDIEIPKHTVIRYIRDRKGQPRGALVAVKTDSGFRVGYSLCNKLDRFSKNMAIKIAMGRAMFSKGEDEPLPHIIRKNLHEFSSRCQRYYK